MSEHDFELDAAPTKISVPEEIVAEDSPFGKVFIDNEEGKTGFDVSKISQSQEQTRAKIAWTFTQIFLLLVTTVLILPAAVSIVFPETIKDPIETTKTLLTVVASILAGPFGFIVGFYFKEREPDRG